MWYRHAGFMRHFLKKYADCNKTKYAAKICGIRPRSHIRIKLAYGNGEGRGEVTNGSYRNFFFPFSSTDYTNLGMPVLCDNFFVKICGP